MKYELEWFKDRIKQTNEIIDRQILDYIATGHFDKLSHFGRQKVIKIINNRIMGGVTFDLSIILRCLSIGRDSSSLQSNILRYGEELGTALFNQKTTACKFDKDRLIQKRGVEHVTNLLSKRGASLANYIERHGEELGTIRWETYKAKRNATYKARAGTYDKRNLDYYISRYGIKDGTTFWKNKKDKTAYKLSREYLTSQYPIDVVNQILLDRYSRGLQYYINKYGIELGTIKHQEKLDKLKLINSKEYLIDIHGELKGIELYHTRRFKSAKAGKRGSKISKKLFDCLANHIPEDECVYYWSKNGEWRVRLTDLDRSILNTNQQNIFVDFKYKQRIIEFFGDFWHANPAVYTEEQICNPFEQLTAKDIRERDRIRIQLLTQKGFDILVIWERDFKRNPELVINECLTFLGIK